MACGPHLEMSVYPPHWELETCPSRPRDCLCLHLGILSCLSSSLTVNMCVFVRVKNGNGIRVGKERDSDCIYMFRTLSVKGIQACSDHIEQVLLALASL